MSAFAARRRWGLLLVATSCLLFWGVHSVLEAAIRPTRFFSGWVLFVLVIALMIFNLRKKLPFLTLGSAVAWMELHTYAGLFSIIVFLTHAGFRAPQGPLEVTLALLFVLVSGSGVVGLALSRLLPIRLNTRGEAILFERIPALRLGLRDEVEELLLAAGREMQATALGEFYTGRLSDFFNRPRNFFFHLLGSPRPYGVLERELWALQRYANPQEREIISEISERITLKHDLDYRHAQELALKGWLFVHIPLTYSLLILALLHLMLVHGFRGEF